VRGGLTAITLTSTADLLVFRWVQILNCAVMPRSDVHREFA
jgi:hypothetical protein